MRRCARPGGQILLLEHGESDWAAVSWWQRHRLNRHVVQWGCYWNRDIEAIVGSAGFEVERVETIERQLATLQARASAHPLELEAGACCGDVDDRR